MNTIQNADPKNPSMNQLPRKMALERAYQTIGGSCQWPASAVVENAGKYRDALVQEYHKYPALVPVFDFMDDKAPGKVRKVKKYGRKMVTCCSGLLRKLKMRWIVLCNTLFIVLVIKKK